LKKSKPKKVKQLPPAPKQARARKPVRDRDARLLSAYVDKNVLHNVKMEAAKLNMNTSDFVRYVVQQALEDEKLKPPPKDL
jgi:hypothetical protein